MHDFSGRVVLVTGGGSGIGRATALAFGRAGATVVVSGRTGDSLAETVKLIANENGRADHITADLSHAPDVQNLISTTIRRHGALDIAFNSAGALTAAPSPTSRRTTGTPWSPPTSRPSSSP